MKYVWDNLLKKRGYKVKCTIGEGAYSKVKLAYSYDLRKNVAIKCISFNNAPKEFLSKFLPRELNTVSTLSHKNIVHVYEVLERYDKKLESSFVCIVMEYAKNGDMLNYIQKVGALPLHEVQKSFRQLCQAVKHCHANKICHRDLKCENLLLGKNNKIILSDFGFCKSVMIDLNGEVDLSSTFCGSAAYAAPETLNGQPYDPFMHDMWSLGVILFIMTSGQMPFDDGDVTRMVKTQNQEYINYLVNLRCGESRHLKNLVRLLLQVDVRNRGTIEDALQHPFLKGAPDDAICKKISSNAGVIKSKKPRAGSCVAQKDDSIDKLPCFVVRSRDFSRFSLPKQKELRDPFKPLRFMTKSRDRSRSSKKRDTSKQRKKTRVKLASNARKKYQHK